MKTAFVKAGYLIKKEVEIFKNYLPRFIIDIATIIILTGWQEVDVGYVAAYILSCTLLLKIVCFMKKKTILVESFFYSRSSVKEESISNIRLFNLIF